MKETNMNFTEALDAMKRGEKVKNSKYGWMYYYVTDGKLYRKHLPFNGTKYISQEIMDISFRDVASDEWEIYKPEPVLNPCGCGGKATLISDDDKYRSYAVECAKCHNHTMRHSTREEAQRDWNRAHPVVKHNTKINVGDWIFFFGNVDDSNKCAKVFRIHDDFIETSCGDVLKEDLIGKAVIETNKSKTNFEKYVTPEKVAEWLEQQIIDWRKLNEFGLYSRWVKARTKTTGQVFLEWANDTAEEGLQ